MDLLQPVSGVQSYSLVYDADTQTWVPMAQPGGSSGGGGTVDQGAAGASPWPVTGPLTDTQVRATPLPVSGAFYPATQPVSGTVGVSGSVAVTGAFYQATQPVSGPVTDTQLRATPVPVSGTVTATTGGLTDTQLRATPVPVSGTFFQGTQPVSLATAPVLVAGSAIIGKVGIDQTTPGTTNKVSIGTDGVIASVTAAVTVAQTTATSLKTQAESYQGGTAVSAANPLQVSLANTAVNGTAINVVGPTLTKGTQGATGVSTQDLKDAGRTSLVFYATAAAAGTTTTETAISLTKASGTSATTTGTSFVITSGKRFRVQSLLVSAVGHVTATTQATTFSLRLNTAGAVTTSSTPMLWRGRVQTPATSLAYQQIALPIPDGYEMLGDGTLQFGVTANAVFTTNAPTWDVTLIGYEY